VLSFTTNAAPISSTDQGSGKRRYRPVARVSSSQKYTVRIGWIVKGRNLSIISRARR